MRGPSLVVSRSSPFVTQEDGWLLRGGVLMGGPSKVLTSLEAEQGEVQMMVMPHSPALRDRGAGTGEAADFASSPWPFHVAGGTTGSQQVRIGPPFSKGML